MPTRCFSWPALGAASLLSSSALLHAAALGVPVRLSPGAAAAAASSVQVPSAASNAQPSPPKPSVGTSFYKQWKTPSVTGPGSAELSIGDLMDFVYVANVTIGDRNFVVQLDTGSSDLWVRGSQGVNGVQDLSFPNVTVHYGSGFVTGTPATAPFRIGQYGVDSQAFINAIDADNAALFSRGVDGILGLSFNSASELQKGVRKAKASSSDIGRSFLANMFASQPAQSNFLAFYLGRNGGESKFSIGEVDPAFSAVLQTPALPVFQSPTNQLQRWSVPLDAVNVDGRTVTVRSALKGTPGGKPIALLDTGTSLAQAPKAVVTAIYSALPGSMYFPRIDRWVVPCSSRADVAFVFGGQTISVDPLDLTLPQTISVNGTKTTVCVNQFEAINPTSTDFLLGDSFLRNAFQLYDFADGIDFNATSNIPNPPTVRLLSVTAPTQAANAFAAARSATLASLPKEADLDDPNLEAALEKAYGVVSSDTSAAHPSATPSIKVNLADDSNDSTSDAARLVEHVQYVANLMPAVLGLLAVAVVLLVGLCALTMMSARRKRSDRRHPSWAPRTGTLGLQQPVVGNYFPVKTMDE